MSVSKTIPSVAHDKTTGAAQSAPHTTTENFLAEPAVSSDVNKPNLSEYRAVAEAAYNLTDGDGKVNPKFEAPDGFSVIARSDPKKLADGFSAVALRDRNGHDIVTFEGTDGGIEGFKWGTVKADGVVAANMESQSLKDAVEFARQVTHDTGKPIFVGGHSLGGIEAEAVAKAFSDDPALKDKFAGGTVFGPTGLPHNTEPGPKTLHIIGNAGDPVFMDSSDFRSDALAPKSNNIAADQEHYGQVQILGDPAAATSWNKMNAQQDKAMEAVFVPTLLSIPEALAHAGLAVWDAKQAGGEHHKIDRYSDSIGMKPGDKASYPFISDDTARSITESGAALKNAGLATAGPGQAIDGELVAPDAVSVAAAKRATQLG